MFLNAALAGCLLFSALQPPPSDLEKIFASMRESQKGIKTLEVRFVQEKKSSLLAHPVTSEGVLSYRQPDLVRWEYTAPDLYTILIQGDTFQAYYPTLKKLKTAHITRMRHRILNFLLATEPLEKLKSHFQVELRLSEKKPTFTLVLTPITPRVAKYISGVTLQMDKILFLPVDVLIREKDGDSTHLVFSDHRLNLPLPDATFRLNTAPGTAVEDYQSGGR
jgi:outer membrane lipoprotein carrier protein